MDILVHFRLLQCIAGPYRDHGAGGSVSDEQEPVTVIEKKFHININNHQDPHFMM